MTEHSESIVVLDPLTQKNYQRPEIEDMRTVKYKINKIQYLRDSVNMLMSSGQDNSITK